MKPTSRFSAISYLLLIVCILVIGSGYALAQTTCPVAKNTLTVNQVSGVNNALDVLFNDMQGNIITIQDVQWKADFWFGYIEEGKKEHNLTDAPIESEPLSGQVAITLTNRASQEEYYSIMVMWGVGKVSTCKDSKGEITVSFENLTLVSKSEMLAKVSGFAKYTPVH